MTISGSIFSMADMGNNSGHLYGKYKDDGEVLEIECIEEDEENGTTYCRVRGSAYYQQIKSSKLYDLKHSEHKLW